MDPDVIKQIQQRERREKAKAELEQYNVIWKHSRILSRSENFLKETRCSHKERYKEQERLFEQTIL